MSKLIVSYGEEEDKAGDELWEGKEGVCRKDYLQNLRGHRPCRNFAEVTVSKKGIKGDRGERELWEGKEKKWSYMSYL